MPEITPNTRLRVSPFYDATLKEGLTGFSPYNRMLMPTSFGQPELEYRRLMDGVALWDVAVERQVELRGPDAADLVQILCMRDLSKIKIGKGKYVPMCNHRGHLINDPVVLKLDEGHFWISIADNAMLLWAQAVADERGMDVDLCEPDVSPLAVQGPMAENVVAAALGDWVRDLRLFDFAPYEIDGIPMVVQRSGYSKQGGFELYLQDGTRGTDLWNIMREAGAPWDIGPGNPNPSERVENGMLSYGGDTDDQTHPYEVNLERFTDLDLDDAVVGVKAARQAVAEGIKRRQLGVIIDRQAERAGHWMWYDVEKDGRKIGSQTNGVWSPQLGTMIGFVLVEAETQIGDRVTIKRGDVVDHGTISALPFV